MRLASASFLRSPVCVNSKHEDDGHKQLMEDVMIITLVPYPARHQVGVQAEAQDWVSTRQHHTERNQLNVPNLELQMASWNKDR